MAVRGGGGVAHVLASAIGTSAHQTSIAKVTCLRNTQSWFATSPVNTHGGEQPAPRTPHTPARRVPSATPAARRRSPARRRRKVTRSTTYSAEMWYGLRQGRGRGKQRGRSGSNSKPAPQLESAKCTPSPPPPRACTRAHICAQAHARPGPRHAGVSRQRAGSGARLPASEVVHPPLLRPEAEPLGLRVGVAEWRVAVGRAAWR